MIFAARRRAKENHGFQIRTRDFLQAVHEFLQFCFRREHVAALFVPPSPAPRGAAASATASAKSAKTAAAGIAASAPSATAPTAAATTPAAARHHGPCC